MSRDLDLLDRRLLFVTGKGGVGKTSVAAALGLLAAGRGQAHAASVEVDAKGNLADVLETGPTAFEPREVAPGPLRHVDGHRGVAARSTCSSSCSIPLLARIGPLARSLDFVANAAPGVKEILTVGKLAWEVTRAALRPRRRRRLGHRPRGRPARRARRPSTSWCRSVASATRPRWMLDILYDPAITGAVIVATPEEMPVTETLELVERARDRDRRRPRRGRRQPGAARAVRPGRGGGVRPALRTARRTPPLAAVVGRPGRPRARRRRAGGDACAAPAAEHLDPPAHGARPATCRCSTCPYLFTRSHGIAGHAASWPRPSARSSGTDGGRTRRPRRRPRRSSSCWRPSEIVVTCGSGGVGKTTTAAAARRRWPPPTSAARCWCSPSTRPGAWPTPSASSSSATSRRRCRPTAFTDAGVEPRGELWAAMLDTKAVVGRPGAPHAPDADDPRRHPGQPALPEHHRRSSSRATTTSPWSGSTRSTRRAATT